MFEKSMTNCLLMDSSIYQQNTTIDCLPSQIYITYGANIWRIRQCVLLVFFWCIDNLPEVFSSWQLGIIECLFIANLIATQISLSEFSYSATKKSLSNSAQADTGIVQLFCQENHNYSCVFLHQPCSVYYTIPGVLTGVWQLSTVL